ncbi:MAG TPA: aminotransferase class V-fold PLP-dependent enzyme [Phycisphaerales bacterium]|nr:aminotransferase class V-fold PLP-dependent enzyme [Phycisphaerales bacterium]
MTLRKRLYLDNAATSFPKPTEVGLAMRRYMEELGASPGRGAYKEAIEAGRLLRQCRERLCMLFNGESANHVVFTLHTTDALNLAIHGLVHHHQRRGEKIHLITTMMDHNSILRPFNALESEGVSVTRVECDPQSGLVDPEDIRAAMRAETRMVAVIHGSNVTGTIQPVEEIGEITRERGVVFLVDGAQTLGHLPIDVRAMKIDLLAFPGHKGLLGPLGTGGLYIRPGLEERIDCVRQGGTGTRSELDVQPMTMPDKYEPGSHNAPGIIGLSEGVKWILDRTVEKLWEHERKLMEVFLEGLAELPSVRLLGPRSAEARCGVFSITMDGLQPEELAAVLEDQYGILVRAGLHCAPLAHITVSGGENGDGSGAADKRGGGAARISFGPFVTETDVRYVLDSLGQIAQQLGSHGGGNVNEVAAGVDGAKDKRKAGARTK